MTQDAYIEGLKKPNEWLPSSKREKDLANYGWNRCLLALSKTHIIIPKADVPEFLCAAVNAYKEGWSLGSIEKDAVLKAAALIAERMEK